MPDCLDVLYGVNRVLEEFLHQIRGVVFVETAYAEVAVKTGLTPVDGRGGGRWSMIAGLEEMLKLLQAEVFCIGEDI